MSHRVRVWDLPTRLFHWALVLAVIGLVVTGQVGGSAMDWHFRFGYSVLALLLFRIVWGLVGGHWSRFANFLASPVAAWHYLRGRHDPLRTVGHNPLGSYSVLALLGFLLLQVGSGLFSDDEIAASGPLTRYASDGFVSLASWYHTEVGKPALIVLVVMHVLAITYYRWRKGEKLLSAMLNGDKMVTVPAPASRDDIRSRGAALLVLLACAGAVLALLQWAG